MDLVFMTNPGPSTLGYDGPDEDAWFKAIEDVCKDLTRWWKWKVTREYLTRATFK